MDLMMEFSHGTAFVLEQLYENSTNHIIIYHIISMDNNILRVSSLSHSFFVSINADVIFYKLSQFGFVDESCASQEQH